MLFQENPMTDNEHNAGRPEHEPTPRTRGGVAHLLRMGASQKVICKIMCMSNTTLHKYYKDLLDTVHAEKCVDLLDTAYAKAVNEGNVQMLIYLLNSLVGLQEKAAEGEDGQPIEAIGRIQVEILPPKLTPTKDGTDE